MRTVAWEPEGASGDAGTMEGSVFRSPVWWHRCRRGEGRGHVSGAGRQVSARKQDKKGRE